MHLKSLFTGLLLAALSCSAVASDLLSVADIEKTTGLSGVQSVPKDPVKGAGGELNFANAEKKLVAIVMIQDASMFDFWNKQYGKLGTSVSGLGSDAFQTKPGSAIPYVVFKKSGKAVWIQSMGWDKAGKANLNDEQLLGLAKLAASRL
ncbi:hypothetical protein ACO0K9_02575 [Undibacterium sp. Ji50W]|uniref:hypothetical protein n=1 Tax=Undibacterium sp. Ji50W TaxID=3413041 RepID=UPI003BEFBBF8